MEQEKNQEIVFHDESTIKNESHIRENENAEWFKKSEIKFGESKMFYNGQEITDYFKTIDHNQQDLLNKIDFLNNKIAELEQKSVSTENKGAKKLEGV